MSEHHSAIAIILARAGSKGLPGKNTAPVAGKPCIAWTIQHAHQSKLLSEVVVSTDCPHAAAVAREHSCLVVDRPTDLASDRATVDDAARHAFTLLNQRRQRPHTHAVILYANVPVRPTDLTDRALDLLFTSRCHSVQSYAPVGKYHPWWTARLDPSTNLVSPWEGTVLNHNIFRRQDLPPAYIPDGGIIALSADALLLRIPNTPPGPHAFFGLDRRGIINPEGAVIDIDARTDLLVADAILRPSST